MTSALDELAKDRPVVVYMNGVAASGGYHISTPAQWIVAQPGTITGSIGVLVGKLVSRGLFENLSVNRVEFSRGANATIYSDQTSFTEAQRALMRHTVEHVYGQFIERVARSRRMSVEAVDAVGGGRVWTGQQALAHGLVDELGDLRAALAKARALADLPSDAPAMMVQGGGKPLVPQVTANPAAALQYVYDNVQALTRSALMLMPFRWDE
jgi:protease-4